MTKQLFYAIETTHPDPKLSAIWQMGGVFVIGGQPVESFSWRVRPLPGSIVDRNVLLAAGLSPDDLLAGEDPGTVCGRLCGLIRKYAGGGGDDLLILCNYDGGHGDNLVMARFFVRNGHTDFDTWFWKYDIDVRQLAAAYLLDECQRLGGFGLRAVADRLGIRPDPSRAHDSLYNAWLIYEVYRKVAIQPTKQTK